MLQAGCYSVTLLRYKFHHWLTESEPEEGRSLQSGTITCSPGLFMVETTDYRPQTTQHSTITFRAINKPRNINDCFYIVANSRKCFSWPQALMIHRVCGSSLFPRRGRQITKTCCLGKEGVRWGEVGAIIPASPSLPPHISDLLHKQPESTGMSSHNINSTRTN